jgi:phosphoribosylformylglycinamidine synthase
MDEVKALVLRAAGINCDRETEYALELAGASAERLHINKVIENPSLLDEFHILVVPGGFSYGDDVAAGKILSNQIIHHLAEKIEKFITDGKLVLGICNGFQVLVKTGILPRLEDEKIGTAQKVTITDNDSGKFEDRWVYLNTEDSPSVFLKNLDKLYLPVAHAEGKVVAADENILEKLKTDEHIALRYTDKDGGEPDYPANPNGSVHSIAGLCDKTGRILGLMPHPERYIHPTQHPHWTRIEKPDPDGLKIFTNAVEYIKQNF